ncbi:MAG: hypothetical protein ABIV47_23800 [Roseiflexaceae bacterium]
MPSHEDINAQMRLLAAHRRTLALLLEQQAMQGAAFALPAIVNGISEARASIQQAKRALRAWNVRIEDLPDDGDAIPGKPAGTEFGRLRLSIVRSDKSWQLIVENPGDQEILSIALTLRPPPSLFVSQTQSKIPRVAARGRAETKPFTIVDPKAAARPRPVSSPPLVSHTQRVRLEQQRDRLNSRMTKADADLDRLERQRRLAAGREQLQREAEIQQLQEDRQHDEQELQTIEAQLRELPEATSSTAAQVIGDQADETTAAVPLHLLVSYSIAGQGIERAEGDILVLLA